MLKDLVPQSKTIKWGNDSFKVRGLTLEDLSALVTDHAVELSNLFEGKAALDQLVLKSPAFAAKLIAYAADEPDQADKVRGLPISVQVAAITEIWTMTIMDEEAFVKQVRGLVSGIARLVALVGVPEAKEKARPKFKIGPTREISPLP